MYTYMNMKHIYKDPIPDKRMYIYMIYMCIYKYKYILLSIYVYIHKYGTCIQRSDTR